MTSASTSPSLPTQSRTAPPAPGAAPDDRTLRLRSVLAAGLPPELGTANEPARYTVPAVFSRQVSPQERARIEDPAAALSLAHGAPGLELEVSDRRLLIKGTNLAELRDGLAADVAALLVRIQAEIVTEEERLSAELADQQHDEVDRASAVAAAAAEIRFE